MRVAITVWGNRISPIFDAAQTILIAEVCCTTVVEKTFKNMPPVTPVSMARKIIEFEPEALICGAISREPARIIESSGITLLPFISGRIDQVLQSYIEQRHVNSYIMPGCNILYEY